MNMRNLGLPLLSIVVPVTRMANQLGTLTEWIQDCNYQNVEIILVHDISDNETGKELLEIIQNNPNVNISLIEGKFGAPGIARNAGLLKANAKWVVFWDSDDQPNLKNVMQILQEEELKNDSEIAVFIGQFKTLRQQIDWNETVKKLDSSLIDISLNPGLWRMVFRRNVIENCKFTNSKMAEDQNFISQIDLPKMHYKIVNIHFYTYYLGVPNQLTSKSEAINDISKAISITLIKLNSCNGESKEFNGMLFIRQVITGITKGSPFVKLSSIKFLSIALFFSGLQTSSTILKNFTFLAKSKNRKL